ncbi:MAG TPA: hypothetical protein VN327_00575, partial [Pseudonocardiaceae bacterium]|nr:hypothetical protein [Pseudonocardiaceae bacterium]
IEVAAVWVECVVDRDQPRVLEYVVSHATDHRRYTVVDEVETAHRWWIGHGKPDADRWRFTVTFEGQRIELISP